MKTISDLLTSLSPEKRALLEMRLSRKVSAASAPQGIKARETKGPLPLTFAQESLWFLNQLEPDSPFYNMPESNLRLRGELNVSALKDALKAIVERHQALRTNFVSINGKPSQIIADSTGFDLPVVDLSSLPEAERQDEMQRWLDREGRCPFDLAKDFKLRPLLLRLRSDDHLLILTVHHIVADLWSLGIFFKELGALYDAFSKGKPSPLPTLEIQYADFAVCQRERLQSDVTQKSFDFWKQEMAGAPQHLELPTDKPRPKKQSFRGRQLLFDFDAKLLASLQDLGNREGVTLFTILLSAFQTLLHRYSKQDDILVGAPIGARNDPQIENLIGLFVNSVVFRADFSANPTFLELLQQMRRKVINALNHMEFPMERVIEELKIPRNAGQNPLYQVLFQHLPAPPRPSAFGNLDVELLPPTETDTAKFDLTLSLAESPEGINGNIEYSTDLYEEETIHRMLGHYKTILEAIAANPNLRACDLPLLTEREKHQLLIEWNSHTVPFPKDMTVPALFEKQVEATPNAVALIFNEGTRHIALTYRELNERVNQLAHLLTKEGVRPETIVAVCMERCVEMVVSVFAILKAGGAYVPLDPDYPKERLAFMLEDSCAALVLAQERFRHAAMPRPGTRLICADSEWNRIALESKDNPAQISKPENLAYIIYTSGSTGQPKGVMIAHDSLCCHTRWMQSAFPLQPTERVLQRAAFSFDVAVWEIFGPLLHGAQLVIAPPGIHRDSAALVKTIAEQKITLLQIVPSQLRAMLNESGLDQCAALKYVIAGGEVLPPDLIARFYSVSKARLFNSYGPTESTIDAAWCECSPNDGGKTSMPIGRPVPQTQVYILDNHLQPVPVGVPGELHLGGRGLARGYWQRPDLTAEKFIPSPFSNDGSRLYKTGDLVRYLPDGSIDFVGRVDHQVKIRGFRIELEEIEAVLQKQPAVREALVAVKEETSGGKRLVAYVVPREKSSLRMEELRAHLKDSLPDYMVPAAFVVMDALPLMANGKVNRNALPNPEIHSDAEKFAAPRTPLEQTIADIWRDVLGLKQVGIHDDFFELGGHSLLATQVLSRVKEFCGKQVTLRDLFEFPTVAEFCAAIEKAGQESAKPAAPALVPLARRQRVLNQIQMLYLSFPAVEHAPFASLAGFL